MAKAQPIDPQTRKRQQRFLKAEKALRAFHAEGMAILESGRKYGDRKRKAEAKGVSTEKLRMPEVFAGRCDADQLERLITEARRTLWPPWPSTLVKLFQVTKAGERRKLWQQALKGDWTRRRLEAACRQAGKDHKPVHQQKKAGRHHTLGDAEEARDKLRETVASLRRLIDDAARVLPKAELTRALKLRRKLAAFEGAI
jgi:hypothetical protein